MIAVFRNGSSAELKGFSARGFTAVLTTGSGVIADYTLIYDAWVFEDSPVDETMKNITRVVGSGLEDLKNKTVGGYDTDDAYIDTTVEDLVDQSESCLLYVLLNYYNV